MKTNKNKKTTSLLIILVTLIWGVVIFRIYSGFNSGSKTTGFKSLTTTNIREEGNDTVYTLSLDYPDPFLKRSHPSSNVTVKEPLPPRIINWPLIEYRGMMTSKTKQESTGLLKVKSSDLLVKPGEMYADIKIGAMTRDSILIVYQDQRKWIRRFGK